MKLSKKRPITPSQRFALLPTSQGGRSSSRPLKSLIESKASSSGRNCYGRITSRRRGGGHRKHYRLVDFKRDKHDIPGKVVRVEYDPNRSADIALIAYRDGEKRYILAPEGLIEGSLIISSKKRGSLQAGNAFPLEEIPVSTRLHAIELKPGQGAKMARSAGASVELVSVDTDRRLATLKMPSGEIRFVDSRCMATLGQVGNLLHQNRIIGKAGRSRWLNKRPRVRGVAMNPVDHVMGGGEGRTSGGGQPRSPWGQLAKGYKTRRKSKSSNRMILISRSGKKIR